jgi:hypothetical protein
MDALCLILCPSRMRLETLKKKLEAEFSFSEIYEKLEAEPFQPGSILLLPFYREYQRPWMTKAHHEWLKGDRTIVLLCPVKPTCRYFKKYVTDVAEVRPISKLSDNNHKFIKKPMIVAIYNKRVMGEPNFTVTFN